MKLFALLFASSKATECFTCAGKDLADCEAKGELVTCQENQTACQVHERKRDGEIYRVLITIFLNIKKKISNFWHT